VNSSSTQVSARIGESFDAAMIVPGAEVLLHPTTDAALVRLDRPIPPHVALPVALGTVTIDATWLGRLLEISGFGQTELGTVGWRRFAVESVTVVDSETFSVSGDGFSGACGGDSGGPALTRGADGRTVAVGILTVGAVSCSGTDRYVRTDRLLPWVLEHVELPFSSPGPCPTWGEGGRCFEGTAVWCAENELIAEACGSRPCGWDETVQRYGCLRAGGDPCEGLSPLGVCEGQVARSCSDGNLREWPCGACGSDCVRSPKTGRVGCLAP
jgi:hypothetical protein